MRTLVIGGTGFIGEYLCRELVRQKNEVIAVYASELAKEEETGGVQYEQIDLNINFLELKRIMGKVNTVVFAVQPDILRMKNIISVILLFNNIEKIVYLSTLLVYPDSPHRQNEETLPDPKTDYEKMKCEEENLLTKLADDRGCSLSIARLGNVYGDVKNKGVINSIFQAILTSAPLRINSPGDSARDYVFIEDAVELLSFLTLRPQESSYEIVNICNGQAYDVQEIKQMVEEITGAKIVTVRGLSAAEKKRIVGNNKKILRLSGYQMKYDIVRGLKKTFENYKKAR